MIPWGCPPNIQQNGPVINRDLKKLLQEHPSAVTGPDMSTEFRAHPRLIDPGCIHPTDPDGGEACRRTYVDTLVSSVYDIRP
jgi:hypothetical protein